MKENPEELIGAEEGFGFRDFFRIVFSHFLLVFLVILAFEALALLYLVLGQPTYEGITTVKVPDISDTPSSMLSQLVPFSGVGDPVDTYVQIAQSASVADRVVESLKLLKNPAYQEYLDCKSLQEVFSRLHKKVDVTELMKSNIISIQARSHNPQLAADIANTWAKAFIQVNLDLTHVSATSKVTFLEEQAKELKDKLKTSNNLDEELKADEIIYNALLQQLQDARIQENINDAGIVVVDAAVVPEKPVWPKPLLLLVAVFIFALAAGVQAALVWDGMQDRIISERQLSRVTRIPNYTVVPDFRIDYPVGLNPPSAKERFSPKALINNKIFEHSHYRESFRTFHTNLTYSQAGKPLQTVAVLSPGPEEGKTLVNANLALSYALTGKKTLLVDADLRKSSVGKIFGLNGSKEGGLPAILTGQAPWKECIKVSGVENLDLLPNNFHPPNPTELLGSESMKKLVTDLKKNYEMIVFDGAPILPVADSVVLSTFLDGLVLLVRWDNTRAHEVVKALRHLRAIEAPVLGTLLNFVRARKGLYGYGDVYGKYKYDETTES